MHLHAISFQVLADCRAVRSHLLGQLVDRLTAPVCRDEAESGSTHLRRCRFGSGSHPSTTGRARVAMRAVTTINAGTEFFVNHIEVADAISTEDQTLEPTDRDTAALVCE